MPVRTTQLIVFYSCLVGALACTDNQTPSGRESDADTGVSSVTESNDGTVSIPLDDSIQPSHPIDSALPGEDTGLWSDAQLIGKRDQGITADSALPNSDAALPIDTGTQCSIDEARCESLSPYWTGGASRYPIVLVHGFMGWDRRWWLDYFYDIPETLHEAGYSVFAAAMDPVASSEVRSAQLLEYVDDILSCLCTDKVNLIGHSQGGLDARMLVGPLDRADAVASITTISSPHLGFDLADDVVESRGLGPAFLDALAVLTSTLFLGPATNEADFRATMNSMSKATRTAYNQTYPDPPTVPIYSYAGFTGLLSDGGEICETGERAPPTRGDIVEPALLVMYGILGGPMRPNDGIVPTADCVWGRFLGCIAADHFDQIGQISGLSDQFDFRQFFREHARFLVEQGH